MSLERIVAVSGLGGKQQRNGSFEYYISEPVVSNDYKGVGPFILASLELQR
jgi:unsaturated rhamnogalacturonyl hydrolase